MSNSLKETIAQACRLLLTQGAVAELRIPHTPHGTVSGYFNDLDTLAGAAARWNGKAPGIYVTLNPVNPALLARAHNRLVEYAKHTTSDTDIIRRHWLPLDFDPVRPAGISSTDAEHADALERARECRAWLRSLGFSALVLADSGNGGHVLVRIDLPNDQEGTALVQRCIEAVALRFSDDTVSVDLSVFNGARIWKIYGTLACKGDATPERPHRLAHILEASADLTPAPTELLKHLASMAPEAPKQHARQTYNGRGSFDLPRWIAAHALDVHGPYPWQNGQRWVFAGCPWNADHTNRGAAYLVQFAGGAIAAGCHHNGCQGRDWPALRDLVEPGWRERRTAGGFATDWHDLDDTAENARIIALEREPATKEKAPRVTLRRPAELVAVPISWRVEGIIPDGMLTVLHAKDKLGKTLLAWEAASAMLRRVAFLGTFAVHPGRVVLALLDDPHDLTVQRRDALGLKDCEGLRIVTPLDADLSDPAAFLVDFKSACQEFKPSFIVLDALYQFAPPGKDSMNDVSRMRGPMGVFNALAETLPAAVLLIAHDRNDGSDVAGSHVIRASAKALLHLTKPKWSNDQDEEDDGRRILTVSSKMTGEARHLLRLQGVGAWSYLGRGDSARQARTTWAQDRVLTWLKEGGEGTAQEIAKAAKLRREDALAALSTLEEQGLATSDMRRTGEKGRPKRIFSVPKDGNETKKETDGNKNTPSLEPAKIAGQSDDIFVPPAWNQAGTKIDLTKPTIDAAFSEDPAFLFPNSSFLGETGNNSCPQCHKPSCTHSRFGWYCGLSQGDKERLAADARDSWEEEL